MHVISGSLLLRAWRPAIRLGRFSSTGELPVIRVARRTQQWLEKRQLRPAAAAAAPQAGKLLISTRRRELNQVSRQAFSKWEQPALVSGGWKHREARGDYFIINRQQEQRAWPETKDTFAELGLDVRLVRALQDMHVTRPTWAQNEAIPSLLRGQNVLCAAETGCGKTLAYLLPIMHQLAAHRPLSAENPRSLVLVPSRELAEQVHSLAARLASNLGLTVQLVEGGQGRRATEKQLQGVSADILVATPGIIGKALKRNKLSLADLHYLVLDEADTLFDRTFSDLVEGILMQTRIASHCKETKGHDRKAQLAIIGATFPKGVDDVLCKVTDLASMHTIKSSKLHVLLPHVQHTFRKVKGEDKIPELLPMLKQHAADKQDSGILIFCNSSKTVNWLGYILDDHGIQHLRLHAQMPADLRLGIFDSFQKSRADVLICTDIASRGLDSCRVGTVVNFDFPFTVEDYLHRAGRVGRVGSKIPGNVLSFVTHAWDVEQVQAIETAVRKRSKLPETKSRTKDLVPDKNEKENEGLEK